MPPLAFSIGAMYGGDFFDRLALADEVFQRWGAELLARPGIASALRELAAEAEGLGGLMAGLGMGESCARCGARSGGGCCGVAMAGENDGFQLLMNRLAGRELTPIRDDGVECFFLGPAGCALLFKPMFCLNYLCQGLRKGLTPEAAAVLERRTGLLLQRQHGLECLLHDACRALSR